ncbi:acyl carrier protein [Streptomyces pactum]|uniref:Acyl carrier protein n=1 Tax=Streptomyces pactum TaxID=68249 RepID=A0ABS0NK52_9ACTN|nr:phosphopantetheine-binding protein [Streptomyces pactum]MBH5335536.1 acyl carrier protein [Streptomyces pactum]
MATTIEIDDLRELVAEVLDVTADSVTEDAHFMEDLGVDSLLALELAVALERKFQIRIESHEMTDITRLRDVHELMQRKVSEAA